MRNAILISILTVVLVVGAASVFAGGPPLNGTYKSSENDFDAGREASSWPAGGGFLSTGGVLHAESWDGATFGVDWKIVCPQIILVTLTEDNTVGGTGDRTYKLDYAGGYVELGGTGPWGGGDASYTGVIDTYTEYRRVLFVMNTRVGSDSDHLVSAHVQNYSQSCVTWGIGNGAWVNESPTAKPATYPTFLDPNCGATATTGHWGPFTDLTISVTGCSVATDETTWGNVKALYRD